MCKAQAVANHKLESSRGDASDEVQLQKLKLMQELMDQLKEM